jgi:hypothetical protein
MASIFTPTNWPNVLGPYAIDVNDCIGDSVGIINANTNYLASYTAAVSSTASTQINNLSAETLGTGNVLQTVITFQAPGNIIATSTITSTGLTPIAVTRKKNNSKFLFELTGGRWNVGYSAAGASATTGHFTWLYVSENAGSYVHYNGSPAATSNSQQFLFGVLGSNSQGPHCMRVLYTPSGTVNTISFLPYIRKFSTNADSNWNLSTDGAANVPIVMSVTEIA